MKNKRRLKILALTLLATFTSATLVTSTIAWFKDGASINFGSENGGDPKLKAGAETFYYAGGTGTQNDPYIISNRTHLYNLAWLQYIGTYNTPSIQQKYFEIQLPEGTTSLDMSGITLPPIGTDTYPFLGNFNGNGYTISNLMVCNDDPKSAGSAFGSAKPSSTSIPNEALPPEVIGFFGVVGKLPAQEITYNSNIVSVSDVVLNNLTVTCKTTKTLIGLAAGYIDGAMSGVRVSGNAKLDLGTGSKQIVSSDITNNVSDYGLVGYSANKGSNGSFSQTISEYYANNDPNHGGASWGGSVDIRKYNVWMYDQYSSPYSNNRETSSLQKGNSSSSFTTSPKEDSSQYHLKMRVENGTGNYVTKPHTKNNTYYDYYANPEDFDDPPGFNLTQGHSSKYVKYGISGDTYLPLIFNEQDETSWATTANHNTGYIVGYSDDHVSPIFTSSYNGIIQNSVSNTHTNRLVDSASGVSNFTSAQMQTLELFTYTSSDGWVMIEDAYNKNHSTTNSTFYNSTTKKLRYSKKSASKSVAEGGLGLVKYTESREALFDTFSHPRVHALHFEGSEVTASNVTNVPSAKVQGETFTNYKVPSGSIDFCLKEDGYVNFFAGSYASSALSNIAFFSIYKVNRSGSSVSSIQRITAVYNNTAYVEGGTAPKYVYDLVNANGTTTTSTGTKGTLVFDVASALENSITYNESTTGKNNCLFYFEIPVNAGEYAMGSVSGINTSNTAGASLIYLDIGTNGADAEAKVITAYSITTNVSGFYFPNGVDFEVVGTTGNNAITTGGVSFGVSIGTGASGAATFLITQSNVNFSTSASNMKYSYQGSNYTDDPPDAGKFNVTNGPAIYEPSGFSSKVRVCHVSVPSSSVGRGEVVITDVFNGASIASTTYEYNGNTYTSNDNNSGPVIPNGISSVAPLFVANSVTTARALVPAITLTRDEDGAIATFDSVLPEMPFDDGDLYDVTINPYPSGLKIIATRTKSRFSLKINNSSVSFDDTNTGNYPTT